MKEAELVEAIQSSQTLAIGGGATRGGGDFSKAGSGIIDYAPDELLIRVKAGTPMEEFEAALEERGQMLAQEPMDHRVILGTNGVPTIGGAIGVNADGPRRLRYGSIREAALGLRFIDGEGEIIRAGGAVMKNVTGLDLTKFFVGSRGALGLALEANFKLLPKPREVLATRFDLSPSDFTQKLLPLLREPCEITGAVYSDGVAYLRQEGESLMPLLQKIKDRLGKGQDDDPSAWRDLRDWTPMRVHDELWRITTPPTQAILLAESIGCPFMVLAGGTQLLVAASAREIEPHLGVGMFAYCEKGSKRGARLPALGALGARYRKDLTKVFDPQGKFKANHAH